MAGFPSSRCSLPVRGTLRLRPAVGPWHRPAFSVAVATLLPNLLLLALGRLDLVLYVTSGSMCAMFTHALPYRERARALVWVALGMTATVGVALTAAATVRSTVALVGLAALASAAHKLICDATRLGPPGNVIFTFVGASSFFVPQRLGEVPAHLGLVLAGGVVAWLVCLAPALVKPHGPALTLGVPRAPRGLRALLPLAVRVGVGCALAGWTSLAAGVGHPYWAVVTAAAVHRANTSVSWQRALQRTVGSVLGLVLFTAVAPISRASGFGTLVALLLISACPIGAESMITRNYWAAQVFVTPMALLLVSVGDLAGTGSAEPVGVLVGDRWLDTVLGAAFGILSALLVTNRRASDRLARALRHTEATVAAAPHVSRARLADSLHELRESADGHAGEWWQRPIAIEEVQRVEREGHRVLALLGERESADVRAA